MRIALAVPLLLLTALPVAARCEPAAPGTAAADRNEARWADWEAQSRMVDGDYDGAVQAERQADADRRDAEDQQPRAEK